MNRLTGILFLILFISCSHPHYDNPHVIIETRMGDIEVELYPSRAPKTVAAFLSYVKSGLYDNSSFYRVLKTDETPYHFYSGIIQGGIWKTAVQKGTIIPFIVHESTKQTGLFHIDGTISMARPDTGSAKTEFFICLGNQNEFDYETDDTGKQGYAAFGKVFSGMDIVRKIQGQKSHGDSFDEQIDIKKISLQ